jgi:hypothetical protein
LESAFARFDHVCGDTIENAPHHHPRRGGGKIALKDAGVVGGGEDRLVKRQADLAAININSQHEFDIACPIGANAGVDKPGAVTAAAIIGCPLHQGARAISNADDRHPDAVHPDPLETVEV